MPARRAGIPAELHRRAFTTAEARAAGVSKAALQGPSVRRIARGVYRVVDAESSVESDAVAALRLLPASTLIAGFSALQIYGVDVGPSRPLRFCTTPRSAAADPTSRSPG